jgi:ABC-2 type transport system permease protein
MSLRATTATAHRVALQLRHDRRTLALLFVVPCALVTLIRFVFDVGHGVPEQPMGIARI